MKKILLLLSMSLFSCTPESETIVTNQQPLDCYSIFSRGEDAQGDFITIGKNQKDPSDRKRYSVKNYIDYVNKYKICNLNDIK